MAIAIETHAFLNGPTAVEMARRFAKLNFNCMWYEEPCLPEFPDSIADIRRQIPLPVCVGERLHCRFMLRTILEKQAADIVMPDITRCGGISEMRKMANLAETLQRALCPAQPQRSALDDRFGPYDGHRSQFLPPGIHAQRRPVARRVPLASAAHRAGFFVLPDRPGLGFDVKEEVLLEHPGVRCRPVDRPFYI